MNTCAAPRAAHAYIRIAIHWGIVARAGAQKIGAKIAKGRGGEQKRLRRLTRRDQRRDRSSRALGFMCVCACAGARGADKSAGPSSPLSFRVTRKCLRAARALLLPAHSPSSSPPPPPWPMVVSLPQLLALRTGSAEGMRQKWGESKRSTLIPRERRAHDLRVADSYSRTLFCFSRTLPGLRRSSFSSFLSIASPLLPPPSDLLLLFYYASLRDGCRGD